MYLLPRPITDIIVSYNTIKVDFTLSRDRGGNILIDIGTALFAKTIIMSISRILIAISVKIIMTVMKTNPIYTLILSGIISLPSTILLLASKILWIGLKNMKIALKSNDIVVDYKFAIKSLLCVVSYFIFKYYDILSFGLFDNIYLPSIMTVARLVKFISI